MSPAQKATLTQAARDFMYAASRFNTASPALGDAISTLGKSARALTGEIVRPMVPMIDSGTQILHGCANFLVWGADRIEAIADHLTVAAEGVKVVHDSEGDPTLDEIASAMEEAGVAPGDTAPETKPEPGTLSD